MAKGSERMTKLTGWLYTDARCTASCPRCGAHPVDDCRQPSGRKMFKPHSARVEAFQQMGGWTKTRWLTAEVNK